MRQEKIGSGAARERWPRSSLRPAMNSLTPAESFGGGVRRRSPACPAAGGCSAPRPIHERTDGYGVKQSAGWTDGGARQEKEERKEVFSS